MTEAANPVVTQATEAAVAQAGPSKDITGAEALAMVQAEKAKSLSSAVPKTAQTDAASTSTDDPKANLTSDAAKEAMRKYKLKVDGEEVEVDEDELKRGYSHQRAANKILQEGKMARKQAEEFISMMKDPQKFFDTAKKLGHDPRDLAEKYLAAQLEDELMDPKDKEIKQLKTEKEIRDREKAEEKEREDAQVRNALKEKYAKEYSDQFVSALESSGLPPTKPMVAEMAKYVSRAASLGFKMTADEAAKLVKEDVLLAHQRLIGEADGDTLVKLLGDNVTNKIRKYDTGKLKDPQQHLKTPQEQTSKPRERGTPHKRMTSREWREFNRKA